MHEAAAVALNHPHVGESPPRARVHREYPIMLKMDEGKSLGSMIDLFLRQTALGTSSTSRPTPTSHPAGALQAPVHGTLSQFRDWNKKPVLAYLLSI